jgi:23S rRNA (cytosine1962-C5)-methyltransferase
VKRVILKSRKAKPFYGRHPWVLDSAVERLEGAPADGDVVELIGPQGNFIARGLFNSQSRIIVRLYTWNRDEQLDEAFWRGRLEKAIELRSRLRLDDRGGAARLAFSEGDNLSGLIVDRYGDYLAVQPTSLAVGLRLPVIVPMLVELVQPKGVMVRTEKGVAKAEGLELRDGPYWGEMPDGPITIEENGLRFSVDLAEGHKTGYYLDQRDNRRVTARYMSGLRVLDMFCYTGAFSLTAAAAGASEVLGVDTSEKAVVHARQNAELNGLTNVRFEQGNCFTAMEALAGEGQQFGGVVLDPPKFARSRRSIDEAMRAYHYLNRLGVELIEPGGILVTCSCSGHVTREDFELMLLGVAQQTRREIQILEQRGAAPDHPVSATCSEGAYLKCFICRVL